MKQRKKFVIETPSVEGNRFTNLPKTKNHAHKWVSHAGGIKCSECKEIKTGYGIS